MGKIMGKSGGLGAKVRGTVQAKTVSGTKNAPKSGKVPGIKSFGPSHATPSGKGKAANKASFSATAGVKVHDPGTKVKNFKGSNKAGTKNMGG